MLENSNAVLCLQEQTTWNRLYYNDYGLSWQAVIQKKLPKFIFISWFDLAQSVITAFKIRNFERKLDSIKAFTIADKHSKLFWWSSLHEISLIIFEHFSILTFTFEFQVSFFFQCQLIIFIDSYCHVSAFVFIYLFFFSTASKALSFCAE